MRCYEAKKVARGRFIQKNRRHYSNYTLPQCQYFHPYALMCHKVVTNKTRWNKNLKPPQAWFCNHARKVDYVAMGALATFSTSLLFLPWGSRSSLTNQFRLLHREVISVLELHPDFLVRLEGPRRPWGTKEEIWIVDVEFFGGTSIRFYFSEKIDAKWLLSPGLWAEKMLITFMEGANHSFSDLLHNLWDEFQSARPLSDLRPGTNQYDTLVLHRVTWTDLKQLHDLSGRYWTILAWIPPWYLSQCIGTWSDITPVHISLNLNSCGFSRVQQIVKIRH